MERKFKTGANNRENYVYYTANGSKIIIEPGKDGVDEEWIKKLHELDDETLRADYKETYRNPVRINSETEAEFDAGIEHNPYLVDVETNPLVSILEKVMEEEHNERLKNLEKALDKLTPLQKKTLYKKFYLNMTNVAIALEEGVTEVAIHYRLEQIYKKIAKKIKK